MAIFYSASTEGFFDDTINDKSTIPADAVKVTPAQHARLLRLQSEGKAIITGEGGSPVAVTRPARTNAEQWGAIRALRDILMRESDWADLAHMRGRLTDDAFAPWEEYRQKLRDITKFKTPDKVVWPTKPGS